jgi:hypothetical protein
LHESAAQRVVLVRAIELADTEHRVWPRERRREATRRALAETLAGEVAHGSRLPTEAFLARRAELACAELERAHREIGRARAALAWPRWVWWVLPLTALALGLAANELTTERRINIISFPLLGMLAWNAGVYALIMAGFVAGVARRRATAASGPLAGFLLRLSTLEAREPDAQEPLARALSRFRAEWLMWSSRLNGARVRTALHTAAAALAAGAIAGMYVRGLAFEYRAGWESTFLTEHAVHRLLTLVLGPASSVTGIGIPGPEHIAALRWPQATLGENAAPWIHLYAATAALFIVIPRLALALWSALVARRLERRFELPVTGDPYFRRLASLREGKSQVVRVIPYSYRPEPGTKEALQNLFAEAFGERVEVTFDEPVAYGAEDDYDLNLASAPGPTAEWLVALFNVATTPEEENHGVFLERLEQALRTARASAQLVVVVNESPYRSRLLGHGNMETRLSERRAAWEALLRERGLKWLALDLDRVELAPAAQRLGALMSGEPALTDAT